MFGILGLVSHAGYGISTPEQDGHRLRAIVRPKEKRMRAAGWKRIQGVAKSGAMLVLLTGAMGLSGVAMAQRGAPHPPPTNQPVTPPNTTSPGVLPPMDFPDTTPDGGIRGRMEEGRVKGLNDDRHKRLASDVDKLVSLTNELKADLSKTTKDELSLDVIRKAQEIEKLAHDVQNRMKN